MLRFFLGACIGMGALAMPAGAVDFHIQGAAPNALGALQDPGIGAGEHIVTGFDGADTLTFDPAHASGYGLFTGSHAGVAAAPVGDTSTYMAIRTGGSVLFDLRGLAGPGGTIQSVSAYLGSIDSYNYIDLLGLNSDGSLDYGHPLLSLGGTVLPGHDGSWYSSLANGRLTFTFAPNERIGGMVFRSTGVAFEFDSIAIGTGHAGGGTNQGGVAPVPEPASWAMMVGGFGLIGGAMRRRRVTLAFA
jgi:hypothetical protein